MTDYEERRSDIINIRLLGAPAKSAAAWLSAVDKAERDGRSCPGWDELERIASSLPPETSFDPVKGEYPLRSSVDPSRLR